MPADIRHAADIFVAVQIKHKRVAATRHIDAPPFVVGANIIDAAIAHELDSIEHMVRRTGLREYLTAKRLRPPTRPRPSTGAPPIENVFFSYVKAALMAINRRQFISRSPL